MKNGPRTKIVLDLFAGQPYRLFTVGRLDKDTAGLILVTNDGHFAQKVIHPSQGIKKEYLAKTMQEITPEHLMEIALRNYCGRNFSQAFGRKKSTTRDA